MTFGYASPKRVLQAVSEITQVPQHLICDTRCRHSSVTFARQLYAAACRRYTLASYLEIAATTGAARSSMLHAAARFMQRDDTEAWLARVQRVLAWMRDEAM